MHDDRNEILIQDLYFCAFFFRNGLLYGEGGEASETLDPVVRGRDEVSEGIVHRHAVAFFVIHHAVRLKDMRVRADQHIDALLHQEGSPLLFILGGHRLILCAPMSYKDDAVGLFFGGFDHGCDMLAPLREDIDHVIPAARVGGIASVCTCRTAVCTVGVVENSNPDSSYVRHADDAGIFLGKMQARYQYLRMGRAPVLQCLGDIIRAPVIHVVGCGTDHVKTRVYEGITNLGRCGKVARSADRVVRGGKDGLLIYDGKIRGLYLIANMIVNRRVTPVSGSVLAEAQHRGLVVVVSGGNDRGLCDNGRFDLFGGLLSGFFLLPCGVLRGNHDQPVVQPVKNDHQKDEHGDSRDEADARIYFFYYI